MVEFRKTRHTVRDVELIEVWVDGKLRAAIYPTEDGVRFISRYAKGEPVLSEDVAIPNLRFWDFKFEE